MKILPILLAFVILAPGCINNNDPVQPNHLNARERWLYGVLVDPSVDSIIVDVDFVKGREPSDLALAGLYENFRNIIPDKLIRIDTPSVIQVPDDSKGYEWSSSELIALSEEHFPQPMKDKQFVHVVYLNGHYQLTENSEAAGVVITGYATAFLFLDVIQSSGQIGEVYLPEMKAEEMERSVLSHEMGHVLGLVNNGLVMQHYRLPSKNDDPCQCHSNQPDSPVYYRYHGDWIMEVAEPGQHIPYLYNEDDLKDIRAFVESYS